jgi:hypothetical protein
MVLSNFKFESQNFHEETEENYKEFQNLCQHSNKKAKPVSSAYDLDVANDS